MSFGVGFRWLVWKFTLFYGFSHTEQENVEVRWKEIIMFQEIQLRDLVEVRICLRQSVWVHQISVSSSSNHFGEGFSLVSSKRINSIAFRSYIRYKYV